MTDIGYVGDSSSARDWGSSYRILVAEDNEVNQELILMLLAEIGLDAEIDIANNGKEALVALENSSEDEPYNIILMDCQMPEMDGFEATRKIRSGEFDSIAKDVVILAVTANALPGDRERCISAGMNDYISKPIEQKKLLKQLEQWLPKNNHVEMKAANAPELEPTKRAVGKLVLPPQLSAFSEVPLLVDNPAAYVRLLKMYVKQNENIVPLLTDLFEQKNIDALYSKLHLLKGSSGTLGMRALHKFISDKEASLRHCKMLAPSSFEILIKHINNSLNDARAIIKENSEKDQQEPPVKNKALFNDLMLQLINKLEENEVIPRELQEQFVEVARAELQGDHVKKIISQLDCYDYEEALASLKAVQQ